MGELGLALLRPPFDMYGLDIVRYVGMHNNQRFLRWPVATSTPPGTG